MHHWSRITTEHKVKLTGKDLLEYLAGSRPLEIGGEPIPSNAEITFRVPTGGDRSGTNVEITEDDPITISWSVVAPPSST